MRRAPDCGSVSPAGTKTTVGFPPEPRRKLALQTLRRSQSIPESSLSRGPGAAAPTPASTALAQCHFSSAPSDLVPPFTDTGTRPSARDRVDSVGRQERKTASSHLVEAGSSMEPAPKPRPAARAASVLYKLNKVFLISPLLNESTRISQNPVLSRVKGLLNEGFSVFTRILNRFVKSRTLAM
jgi:hypothetical protein